MKTIRLSTPVDCPQGAFRISPTDGIMLVGSCFSENIGARMQTCGLNVMLNPFGILYNPLSMAEAVARCMEAEEVGEELLVQQDGLWHSWLHHGRFSRIGKADCLGACNEAIREAHRFMQHCNVLIVTFGSAWCYRLKTTGRVVANCHKVPSTQFEKCLLTVDEVVAAWRPLVEAMEQRGVRMVFTISPVRHGAYGAHGNQLGKAVLLLAIEELLSSSAMVDYFPAYEVVMDELRDYRFYADDMLHPSPLAEQIVWQRFQETYMDAGTIDSCDAAEMAARRASHRPLHTSASR